MRQVGGVGANGGEGKKTTEAMIVSRSDLFIPKQAFSKLRDAKGRGKGAIWA